MAWELHVFYVEPVGGRHQYRTATEAEVLELVKLNNDPDSNVKGLKVIYGHEMEFEPAKIVESYRFKMRPEDL